MKAIEDAAITSGRVTGLMLMERAGRSVCAGIFEAWPELAAAPHTAVVLCGPGNNGGDGFVIARLLRDWGWSVTVYLLGTPEKMPPDARVNHDAWCQHGPVHALPDVPAADMFACDVVIDALFGTGLSRPLAQMDELLHDLVSLTDDFERHAAGARVVAVDVASGICADSGRELRGDTAYSNGSVEANLTVTFHRAKRGHHLANGYAAHRSLVVKDIGLTGEGAVHHVARADLFDLRKHHLEHKYSNGHAMIVTGGFGKTGAARLAARAALRIGAGVVTLGVPGSAQMEVATHITSELMVRLDMPDQLGNALQDTRLRALCLGPGLGRDRARALVPAALAAQRYVVLDADALTAFENAPEKLFDMLTVNCVLTPHPGEFRRLFPDISAKLNGPVKSGPAYSKVDAVREAAARAGCTILLKGADTVIASQKGQCALHSAQYEREAPWLATAGSGDVLAGLITGLLARGFWPMDAAKMGAWLHTEAARSFGAGLIAEDLPEELPGVLRDLYP